MRRQAGPTTIWYHIRNKQYRYCGAAKRRRISVGAPLNARYDRTRGLWRLPGLGNFSASAVPPGPGRSGDNEACRSCVAHYTLRRTRVYSLLGGLHEPIKFSRQNNL